MRFVGSGFWLALLLYPAWAEEKKSEFDDLDDETDEPPLEAPQGQDGEIVTKPYKKPDTAGHHFVETFDGDVFSRWKKSRSEKYNGQMVVQKRKEEALIGDLGLLAPDEARHYGISAKFNPIEGEKGKDFVFQYEARFQDDLMCGGSYVKLFDTSEAAPGEFKDNTRYVIMFGPDRCGGTNKVHFILQHKSPKTGVWEEKHFKDPPTVPHDKLTHLYKFVLKRDNAIELWVDDQKQAEGNLLSSLEPPVNPPKEIDDPEDKKPSDWVDEPKIDDPASSKPDDWDEDEPMKITDPEASMPEGWNEDAERMIPDPDAQKPSDWDNEEDGDWEAPTIENPACKIGCGKWEAPKIDNPKYKGKWYAPKIDNPAYKGEWFPRKIDNPNYFLDEEPYKFPKIDAVGFDLWTMQGGLHFDNILISRDIEKAQAFADETFKVRAEIEQLQKPKSNAGSGLFELAINFVGDNVIPVTLTSCIVIMTLVWFCCLGDGDVPAPPPKKKDAAKASSEANEDKQEEKKEEKKTAKKEEKKKDEGGVGTLDTED